ncbi:FAD binding domain-containing protein [Crepidotus variabilis]|uniref:FAD binding domain-containing protein n=1 Tax=Crepidotus variabilis TaxID=179855 RepID=A0A9P6EAH2_9AGAR|nr:FAD binding domain-containing protein [Crepidotus variabilis]
MTSNSIPPPKVLVVGAGPTGLTLALSLLRQGIHVRVIDKNLVAIPGQRGSGIFPRTLEVLEALGLLQKVEQFSIAVPKAAIYGLPGGKEVVKEADMINSVDPTPAIPHPNAVFLGQNHLEAILSDAVTQHGGVIDRGVELKSLEQVEDRVRVVLEHSGGTDSLEDTTYLYVAGADGGKSTVRKTLNFPFLGETREDTQVVFGDFFMSGLSQDRIHVWGDVLRKGLFAKPTETPGLFSLILGGDIHKYISSLDKVASVKEMFKEAMGGREDVQVVDIVWHGIYRFNIRMSPEFSKGHVFLGGDAAHVHSPTGGQGLNTGVQDAYNLGWKLALVIHQRAPPLLLDSYNLERVPIVAEMLDMTTKILSKTLAAASDTPTDASVLDRGGKLHQLGVNYRTSRIVIDDGDDVGAVSAYGGPDGGPVRAGDRAPDASGLVRADTDKSTRLFEIFDSCLHTVLIFIDTMDQSSVTELSPTFFSKYSCDLVRFFIICQAHASPRPTANASNLVVYEDKDGHAYQAYASEDKSGKIFVVRPDGYVGARLRNMGGVEKYFTDLLGINL